MATLIIILLSTVLIQGSAIAVGPLAAGVSARGVFADEFRTALFTLLSLTLASLLGVLMARQLLPPLQLQYLLTPALLLGVALIYTGTRAVLEKTGALRGPELLTQLTTQCAMLGMALFSAGALESVGEALGYGVGAAALLALLGASFAALRERIDAADTPMVFRGIPIALITAGFMALALMGFAGMIRY